MNTTIDSLRDLEKKSSAVTLSDMEMFIFPDLLYSLMLANIMSPILWRWKEDPWFKGIKRKGEVAQINRLKQYIMDHYSFNLDLGTWGLTTKEKELSRFEGIVDTETLSQSNALFGYEGDKYYFDIDIRRHFGLDKYEGFVIPYWKTETIEAMTAFDRRPGYQTGAGECVSLAAIYAASLFVVLDIPLEDIYMMATPLHSQNFIDLGDGIITNNRRVVTKNMWFNGTALSGQARRSMEHERITLVAHESGTIHIMYPDATISPDAYAKFRSKLSNYLSTELTPEMLGNFLRQSSKSHCCFLVRHERNGVNLYVPLARAFEYERDCPYKVTDKTLSLLLAEMDHEEFSERSCDHCIVLNDIQDYLTEDPVDIDNPDDVARLVARFKTKCMDADMTVKALVEFCHLVPRMPEASEKTFLRDQAPLEIVPGMSREQIIARVETIRERNEYCRFAFYAYRDLGRTDALPFMKAAVERNPVCIDRSAIECPDEVSLIQRIETFTNESIYEEEGRLAQPDEVWNFGTGDGLEKAITLGVVLFARNKQKLSVEALFGEAVLVRADGSRVATFASSKVIREKKLVIGG